MSSSTTKTERNASESRIIVLPTVKPISERPLDILYLTYFTIHLLASIAIDAQLTFPPYSQSIFPTSLKDVLTNYLTTSRDPFLLAALNRSPAHIWFRVLLASETLVQIPCFFVGIWGLWKDEKRVYPLLVMYGTLAASSTLQCIFSVLYGVDGKSLSPTQVRGLLQNYIPFCFIPTLLTLDMMLRIVNLLSVAPPLPPSKAPGKTN